MPNKLLMTFDEYIKNPSGRGSAVNTARDSIELSYNAKLGEMISKNGDIKYTCLKSSDSHTYYIYFLMPSESTKDFNYDVVIQLDCPKGEGKSAGDIKNYTVKFFSNDPSFTFTYAHAYKSHGLLIPVLERKMNLRALNTKANVRNPDNVIGYVKNIYFAYLLMKKYNLFDKSILDRKCIGGGTNYLTREIPSFDKKESLKRQIIQDQKSKASKESSRSKIVKSSSLSNNSNDKPSGIIRNSKLVKTIGKIKPRSSSHIIKKSKKI